MQELKRCPFCGELPTISPKNPEIEGNTLAEVMLTMIDFIMGMEEEEGMSETDPLTFLNRHSHIKEWFDKNK